MVIANKNRGFVTIALLVFMSGVVLTCGSKIKKTNKERYDFYGQNISFKREQQLLAKDVFYFDFNSYAVQEDDRLSLIAHARKMLRQPKLNILIAGHTDSIGLPLYNIKLGLSRAKTIADVLNSKGVNLNRMIIVSYGDQVPVINSDSVDLNRRAEIVYQIKEKK